MAAHFNADSLRANITLQLQGADNLRLSTSQPGPHDMNFSHTLTLTGGGVVIQPPPVNTPRYIELKPDILVKSGISALEFFNRLGVIYITSNGQRYIDMNLLNRIKQYLDMLKDGTSVVLLKLLKIWEFGAIHAHITYPATLDDIKSYFFQYYENKGMITKLFWARHGKIDNPLLDMKAFAVDCGSGGEHFNPLAATLFSIFNKIDPLQHGGMATGDVLFPGQNITIVIDSDTLVSMGFPRGCEIKIMCTDVVNDSKGKLRPTWTIEVICANHAGNFVVKLDDGAIYKIGVGGMWKKILDKIHGFDGANKGNTVKKLMQKEADLKSPDNMLLMLALCIIKSWGDNSFDMVQRIMHLLGIKPLLNVLTCDFTLFLSIITALLGSSILTTSHRDEPDLPSGNVSIIFTPRILTFQEQLLDLQKSANFENMEYLKLLKSVIDERAGLGGFVNAKIGGEIKKVPLLFLITIAQTVVEMMKVHEQCVEIFRLRISTNDAAIAAAAAPAAPAAAAPAAALAITESTVILEGLKLLHIIVFPFVKKNGSWNILALPNITPTIRDTLFDTTTTPTEKAQIVQLVRALKDELKTHITRDAFTADITRPIKTLTDYTTQLSKKLADEPRKVPGIQSCRIDLAPFGFNFVQAPAAGGGKMNTMNKIGGTKRKPPSLMPPKISGKGETDAIEAIEAIKAIEAMEYQKKRVTATEIMLQVEQNIQLAKDATYTDAHSQKHNNHTITDHRHKQLSTMKRSAGEPTGEPIVESQFGIPNALFVFAEQSIKDDGDYIIFPEMFCNFYILFFIYLSSAFSHILKMLSSISFQPRGLERDARDESTAQIDLAFNSHQQKLKSTLNDLEQLLYSGIGSGVILARSPFSDIFTQLESIFYTKPITTELAGSLYEIVDSRSKSVVKFLESLGYGNSSETLEVAVSDFNLRVFAYCRRIHNRVPQTLTLPGLYYSLLSIVYGDKRGEFTFNFRVTDDNIEPYARQIIEQAKIQIRIDSEFKIIEEIIDSLKKRQIIKSTEHDDLELVPGIIYDIKQLLANKGNSIFLQLFKFPYPKETSEILLLDWTPHFFKICMFNLIMSLSSVLLGPPDKLEKMDYLNKIDQMIISMMEMMKQTRPTTIDFKEQIKSILDLKEEDPNTPSSFADDSVHSIGSMSQSNDGMTDSVTSAGDSVPSAGDYFGEYAERRYNQKRLHSLSNVPKVIKFLDKSKLLDMLLNPKGINEEFHKFSSGGSKRSNRIKRFTIKRKKPVSRHFNGTRKIMNKSRTHISKNLRKKQNKKTTYKNKNQRKRVQ